LRVKHDVRFYTFSRQYPQRLFPGKTDRDSSREAIIREPAEAVLDGLNPFTWRRTARRMATFNPDLVIIPWWTSFFAPPFRTIARAVHKRTSAPVLFVCHNVIEHERRFYGTAPTRLALCEGQIFIVHSEEERENLLRLLPGAVVRKAFLPVGSSFSAKFVSKEEARRALDATGNVLLFFGFVRPYKGLEYLIEALPEVLRRHEVKLFVAGEFWKDKADYETLIRDRDLERNVRLVDRYIPNEEVGTYFAACDAVVLPYVGASQSGIVQLAYEFGRPVVATTAGGLPDVVEDGKTGYLVPPRDSRALADAIVKLFSADRAAMEENCKDRARTLSWDALVEQIELLYEEWTTSQGSAQDKRAELEANRAKLDEQGARFSSSGWGEAKFARALRPLEAFLDEVRPLRRILEIGCGGMALTAELFARGLQPIAIDLDETLLRNVSAKRLPEACLAAADAERLPFRDGSFDLVIHNQTLHHFPRRDRVLREIRRVLKPKGKLYSIETNGWNPYVRYIHGPPWERSKRHISSNQSVFGLKRFISELRRAGLDPVSTKMINFDFIKILSPFDDFFGRIPLFNVVFGGSMVVCSEKPGDKHEKAREE
jgi:glycosyltransferase involved in cell wall biosynthesis/SAM-dependent methyltransferase